ncbi:hypothetical protein JX265_006458 [Neoarthrinium moseri]|uniref:Protein kinase domain-containing protein n=1 Tax=Neoarthrinium moseri TaxID=1658444 RepID=A0A9P9WLR9_9PEZI|nr:hypothetical protein JX265_006458 [Neoarthrinium moseri]
MIQDFLHFPEEHPIVPSLILIDFGKAKFGSHRNSQNENPLWGVERNLLDISKLMYTLMTGDDIGYNLRFAPHCGCSPFPDRPEHVIETYAVQLIQPTKSENTATIYPFLDRELLLLVARCLAVERQDRPNLETLLDTVQRACHEREEAYYEDLGCDQEADSTIQQLVRDLILDANDPLSYTEVEQNQWILVTRGDQS